MGIESEVKNRIMESWKNEQVACWVIKNLPLLEVGFTQPSCSVYTFSLENGLVQKYADGSLKEFQEKPKLVMSGGFEGTVGHLTAIANLHEIRALTTDGDCDLVLMLEPDSYIRNTKKREPLTKLYQREKLWASSGLVDAVVLVPDSSFVGNKNEYFSKFSEHFGPMRWCTSIENPNWREIVTRNDMGGAIDVARGNVDEEYVHASLLAASKDFDPEETKKQIYEDILSRVIKMESPDLLRVIPPEVLTERICERVSDGL